MRALRYISVKGSLAAIMAMAIMGCADKDQSAELSVPEYSVAEMENFSLGFHMVRPETNNAEAMEQAKRGRVPPGSQYVEGNGQSFLIEKRTKITADCIKFAAVKEGPDSGNPVILFDFNFECAKLFGEITTENVGEKFAVVVNDKVIASPVIRSPILGGSGIIDGGYTLEEAQRIAGLLMANAKHRQPQQ